jgi:hypothetical protein
MAELAIVIAGVHITVPVALHAAGVALETAYSIYSGVTERREQIGVCLGRCQDILVAASKDKRLTQSPQRHDPYSTRQFSSKRVGRGRIEDGNAEQFVFLSFHDRAIL